MNVVVGRLLLFKGGMRQDVHLSNFAIQILSERKMLSLFADSIFVAFTLLKKLFLHKIDLQRRPPL